MVKKFGGKKKSRNFASFLKHKKIVLLFNLHTKMKKLFLSFAVLAGVCMVSCGNKAENAEEAAATDSAATEVVEGEAAVVVDSINDSTAVVAAEVAVDSAAVK